MRGFLTGLGRAARIYLPVHLLPALLFHSDAARAQPASFLARAAQRVLWSSIFLSGYTAIMKHTVCTLRALRQQDSGVHSVVGGILAGGALFAEYPSRHLELLLFCIPRSLEALLNLAVRADPTRLAPLLPRLLVLLFAVGMSAAQYVLRTDPAHMRSVNRGVLQFLFGANN